MAVAITVRYWAGAARAAGCDSETMTADTLDDVRLQLAARPGLAAVVDVASFLVDGLRTDDAAPLPVGAQVDVLPPFAGG